MIKNYKANFANLCLEILKHFIFSIFYILFLIVLFGLLIAPAMKFMLTLLPLELLNWRIILSIALILSMAASTYLSLKITRHYSLRMLTLFSLSEEQLKQVTPNVDFVLTSMYLSFLLTLELGVFMFGEKAAESIEAYFGTEHFYLFIYLHNISIHARHAHKEIQTQIK